MTKKDFKSYKYKYRVQLPKSKGDVSTLIVLFNPKFKDF